MASSLLRFLAPAALAAALLAFPGCAGSKSSSSGSDYSSMPGGNEAAKSAKLDDARRSAEEAEEKAHQLREEKARTQSKTSPN